MDSDLGEILTRWSVRLAVGCYLGRVLLDVAFGRSGRGMAAKRRLWTAGCVLYLLHVACAFTFFHNWSHADAYRHTAEQTAAATGLNWGGGLYFNYAFTLLWVFDTVRWWLGGLTAPVRSTAYFRLLHAVFAFMMINATIVFGPPIWRWLAPAVLAAFGFAYLARRRTWQRSRKDEALAEPRWNNDD
ncbi:MAG: hypothetical protein DWQ34_07325 [Planctomycetota bacterium]|nr:MAG: hypothetical protein DWQ34_07325 [Planctomycetota bacterium]REK23421.1 MAG: hypothetical protein DWQ41_16845 [Planctomycetota bacterium]REK38942.1 MAG: hypothetical protein DWQ45_03625 [Planctomycetota bacterium]